LNAVKNILGALPPVFTFPEFVDVAAGALRGRSQDLGVFKALLDDLEAWNHQAYQYDRKRLSIQEAADILKAGSSENPLKRAVGPGVISIKPALVLIAAAMQAAGNNPVLVNRNIGIILEPICGADRLASLHNAALSAITGDVGDSRLLLGQLRMFGGLYGEPPICPDYPPRPTPCPGGAPWPPRSDSPRLLPWTEGDCGGDGEWIDAFRDILERRTTYSITGISPQGACPGDTIVITGTGFLFEGNTGVVNFPGLEWSSYVPSEAPLSWTDTEIRVVVPEGVSCGAIELVMPPGIGEIFACGLTIQLFTTSESAAVPFVGGVTRIDSFRSRTPLNGCLAPGQVVQLIWRVCNADRISLVLTGLTEEVSVGMFGGGVGGTSYAVPDDLDQNTSLTFVLNVSDPCGSDTSSINIAVRKGRTLPLGDPVALSAEDPFVAGSFVNFLGNIGRNDIRVATPTTLSDLLQAIEFAEEAEGARIGVTGGACSYNDFIVPRATTNRIINTDALVAIKLNDDWEPSPVWPSYTPPRELRRVISAALRPELDDTDSIMSRDVLEAYRNSDPDHPVSPLSGRLVHVEAGMRFRTLVCLLDHYGFTMPTLGGGTRHSVAGAISTGTHGATTRLPPIADFVRAIHLVGTGGQQWWLEPATKRITDPILMGNLKREGILDPCLEVRYDDNLFYAALVSFGTAGVFYPVIIETINSHRLAVQTTNTTWLAAQETLRTRLLGPAIPSDWFFEITTTPTGQAWLTTMNLTIAAETPPPEGPSTLNQIADVLGGIIPRLYLRIPVYIARMFLRVVNPLRILQIWREIRETFELAVSKLNCNSR